MQCSEKEAPANNDEEGTKEPRYDAIQKGTEQGKTKERADGEVQ